MTNSEPEDLGDESTGTLPSEEKTSEDEPSSKQNSGNIQHTYFIKYT